MAEFYNRLQQIITFLTVQLIVIFAFVIFYLFRYEQTTIRQALAAGAPLLIITALGATVIINDYIKMKRLKRLGEQDDIDKRYNMVTQIKHDFLVYLGTLLIIGVVVARREPVLNNDLLQAAAAFGALGYTRYLYWSDV